MNCGVVLLLVLACFQCQAAPPAAAVPVATASKTLPSVTAAKPVVAAPAPAAAATKPGVVAAAPAPPAAATKPGAVAAAPAAATKPGAVAAAPSPAAAAKPGAVAAAPAAKGPPAAVAQKPAAPGATAQALTITVTSSAAEARASAAIAAAAAAVPAADTTPAATWLQKNGFTKFAGLLEVLDVRLDDASNGAVVGTLLVPTNAAIDAFSKAMGFSPGGELSSRAPLVDRLVSYHFMPGTTLADFSKQVPVSPAGILALSGDMYVFKVIRDAAGKVTAMDAQKNFVPLTKPPTVLGKLAIIPIDAVLFSGGYFTTPAKALAHYPDWQAAGKLLAAPDVSKAVDGLIGDLSLFVPDNAALKAVSAAQAAEVMKTHTVKPSVQFPTWAKAVGWTAVSGKFIGLTTAPVEVVLPWTTQKSTVKLATLVPDTGPNANVTIYNIYAGQAILHGINRLLYAPPAAAAAAAAPKPAGRHLLVGRPDRRRSLQQAFLSSAKVPSYSGSLGGVLQAFPTFFGSSNAAAVIKASSSKSAASWKAGWNPLAAPAAGSCFNCGFVRA